MTDHRSTLLTKIQSRELPVAVIGLGYVGLPLAVELAKAGFQTTGIDLDPRKIEALTAGRSTIEDVPTAEAALLVRLRRWSPPAPCEPRPTSASWPGATRSRSACRRR